MLRSASLESTPATDATEPPTNPSSPSAPSALISLRRLARLAARVHVIWPTPTQKCMPAVGNLNIQRSEDDSAAVLEQEGCFQVHECHSQARVPGIYHIVMTVLLLSVATFSVVLEAKAGVYLVFDWFRSICPPPPPASVEIYFRHACACVSTSC